jgi:hypothetical protein
LRIRRTDVDAYMQDATARPIPVASKPTTKAVSAEDFWLGTALGETIHAVVAV